MIEHAQNFLSIEHLCLYGDKNCNHKILDIDAFDNQEKPALVLSGISGSGKTSFLYAIAGLYPSIEGKIFWADEDIYQITSAQRDQWRYENIGFIFQNFQLIDELSVIENIMLPLTFRQFALDRAKKEYAQSLIDLFEIPTRLKNINKMSRGEKQRIAFARAMINDPNIILADEPTASLDQVNSDKLIEQLKQYAENQQKQLIIVSHDPRLIEKFEHHTTIENGKIIKTGAAA